MTGFTKLAKHISLRFGNRLEVFLGFFFIHLPPEFLPVLGPLTRWCASTLGAALLSSSWVGSDLGLVSRWVEGFVDLVPLPRLRVMIDISTSFIRRRGSNYFFDKSKNAIGIGGIWTRGCSMTSDAANPPATTAGFCVFYLCFNFQNKFYRNSKPIFANLLLCLCTNCESIYAFKIVPILG